MIVLESLWLWCFCWPVNKHLLSFWVPIGQESLPYFLIDKLELGGSNSDIFHDFMSVSFWYVQTISEPWSFPLQESLLMIGFWHFRILYFRLFFKMVLGIELRASQVLGKALLLSYSPSHFVISEFEAQVLNLWSSLGLQTHTSRVSEF